MTECFDCDNCKESLYGRKYIQMDNGPYCIPCYDAHFANTCDECKELIGHDCRVSTGPVLSIVVPGSSSPPPPLTSLSSPGAVLRGSPLPRALLPLLPLRPLAGRRALHLPGRGAAVQRLLLQRVLLQVHCLREDGHAR